MDEQVFDLEPNELLYEGNFSVLKIQEDRLNRKLWYVLNTLDYLELSVKRVAQCMGVLKWSYVYGYFIDNSPSGHIFNFIIIPHLI